MEKQNPDNMDCSGRIPPTVERFCPPRLAKSRFGMTATANYHATEAAAEVLQAGGNAIDAAVAAGFALGVCEPAASGLGGQTMMMIHTSNPRRTFALDGSSRAPHRTPPGKMPKKQRLRGHRATTVPSTPAVLAYALRRYGSMPLGDILSPAIRLASVGYTVSELQNFLVNRELKHLRAGTAAPLFLKNGLNPYPAGSRFCQPVLTATFKQLAQKGIEDFYLGEIAAEIHRDMVDNQGLIREDDLAQVPWPIERRPLSCRFMGRRVLTLGPPGAGRVLVEMLNVLDAFSPERLNPDSPENVLLLAEIIRRANLDRQDRPFDPNFYPQIQGRQMVKKEYAKRVALQIRAQLTIGNDTTHLSVMDRHGNTVALTQSIEQVFGSFAASPRLGFLYNNYMSAFEFEDMCHPHYFRPNAVPWASVAPTLVFQGKFPWLAIGSPGSERIASTIMQVLLRMHNASPLEAVEAPRLHCSINGKVSLEAARMHEDIPDLLVRNGYTVDVRKPYSFYLGCVQMVMKEKDTFIGVADPRRDGSAKGPVS